MIYFSLFFVLIGCIVSSKTKSLKYIGIVSFGLGLYIIIHYGLQYFHTPIWVSKLFHLLTALCLIYFLCIEIIIFKDSKATCEHNPQYIIVHGAKIYGSTPSLSLANRVEGTYRYMEQHSNCIAILTGAKWAGADTSEAQFMFEYLTACGISADRLLIEDNATDTLENIRLSMKLLYEHGASSEVTVGLLTSDYHLHRALYIAKKENISAIGISVQTSSLLIAINYFIREVFAMTELYLFGVEGL